MKSIKAEAKSSRATKLHAMGGKGSPGKSYDLSPGHTFDGQAGLNSSQVYDTQRIPTRKSGGRVEGERAKARMDRKGARKRADGGSTGRGASLDRADDDYNAEGSSGPAGRGRFTGFSRSGAGPESDDPRGDKSRSPRASGGRVGKGKTNITVVVAPQGGAQQPQMPPQKIPVPVSVPPAPPMGGPPGVPPGAMPGGAPMGGAMPPQMMRKSGGRVKMTAGALSGEGRLQKIALQKAAGK